MSGHTYIHTHIHTHAHTHTHTHDNYSNPRCAHAHRGLINPALQTTFPITCIKFLAQQKIMSIISAVHLNITYANSLKSRNVLHPPDAVVAGPILIKIARATHGKPASRKLRNTLLGYIKKQQIVEFMLLHSKNAQK